MVMKKIITILLFGLLVSQSESGMPSIVTKIIEDVSTENVLSFRSQALGGIILDDLDLIYDPIELKFVDGIRLYTNLSNLTSSNEKIFGDQSDNEFLIGLSIHNPKNTNFWHSFLIKLENNKSPGPENELKITHEGNAVNITFEGEGEIVSEYTSYWDSNSNDFFDIKKTDAQEKYNYTYDNDYSLISNTTFNKNNLTYGTKISFGRESEKGDLSSNVLGNNAGSYPDFGTDFSQIEKDSPSFNNYTTWQLALNEFSSPNWFIHETSTVSGDFVTRLSKQYMGFDFSILWPWGNNYELRGDLSLYKINDINEINDFFSAKREKFDEINQDEEYRYDYLETHQVKTKDENDGLEFGIGMSVRNTFNKKAERKNDGFWDVGLSFNIGNYDYDAIDLSHSITDETERDDFVTIECTSEDLNDDQYDYCDDGYSDYQYIYSDRIKSLDKGNMNVFNASINSRTNIPINENILLGIGAYLNNSISKRNTKYTESITIIDSVNYVDAYTASIYNQVETRTTTLIADRDYEINNLVFQFPVGLEIKFGKEKKWSTRFGSIFTRTNSTIKDSKQIKEASPETIIHEDINGMEYTYGSESSYNSTSESVSNQSSSTVFRYGLGCNPTKNLQIDLLGFLNFDNLDANEKSNDIFSSEFFENLKLSFTLKF